MLSPLDDYIDADVSYLLGLIIGRGTITDANTNRQLLIEFPYTSLQIQGIASTFDQETAIRLGIEDIRERLLNLLDTDISTVRKEHGIDLVARFQRPSMIWRNILYILEGATSYPYFRIPKIFYNPELPRDWKREFVRGYADVAGNIRASNNYMNRQYRVRLDILNYPTNWEMPMQLCFLLQEQLDVPVQLITYGHPNLGRAFKEHQLNVFVRPFLNVGFTFAHKQQILEEFAAADLARPIPFHFCPGIKRITKRKDPDPEENNADKLDPRLVGKHFDAYWEICKQLGCTRRPPPSQQLPMGFLDEEVIEETVEEEEAEE